jgi:hypothetical protein
MFNKTLTIEFYMVPSRIKIVWHNFEHECFFTNGPQGKLQD